jgi:hypothetical protein
MQNSEYLIERLKDKNIEKLIFNVSMFPYFNFLKYSVSKYIYKIEKYPSKRLCYSYTLGNLILFSHHFL